MNKNRFWYESDGNLWKKWSVLKFTIAKEWNKSVNRRLKKNSNYRQV